MRVIIDAGHPAHIHLFRYFADEMTSSGHQVLFTVRNKEYEIALLDSFGLEYVTVGRHYSTSSGKVFGLVKSVATMLRVARSFRPDLFLSHGSIIAAVTSWLTRKPHVSMEDTGNPEQVRLYLPFTDAVLTSTSFHRDYGTKQIRYNGFHELAYLHPKRFTPDPGFRARLGIEPGERLVILRFVSWGASHDRGMRGLSEADKVRLVRSLAERARVYISSEKQLTGEMEKYRYPLPPVTMHQALAAADLFIGEGATMASESALLGTPAVYINPIAAGTINDQSRHGLIFQFMGYRDAEGKIDELLTMENPGEFFGCARSELLKDKIDLTGFLVWFIEQWPDSMLTLKMNPDYQERFGSRD